MGTCPVTWGGVSWLETRWVPPGPFLPDPVALPHGISLTHWWKAPCLPMAPASGTSSLPLREAVPGPGLHLPIGSTEGTWEPQSAPPSTSGAPPWHPAGPASVAGACHSEGSSSGHPPARLTSSPQNTWVCDQRLGLESGVLAQPPTSWVTLGKWL